MEENDATSKNLSQLVLLFLAFIAGIFAAKLWYDMHPVSAPLGLPAPEEIEISTQVQESSMALPDLPDESGL